jgi:site-specific DNA-methyltransferase (adenine-specific)
VKVRTSTIEIPERFRVNYGDLGELSNSIKKLGLIEPIVITYDEGLPVLIAGARRLLACLQAGIEEVEVTEKQDLDEEIRKEIEIEENIMRKQFTWQEEVRAKAELMRLREAKVPPSLWGGQPKIANKVAEELGEAPSSLSQDVQLAKALEEFPELAEEENKTTAFKKYKKILQSKALAVISAGLTGGENLWYYNGDCREELDKIPSKSVSLLLTDPPWGVEVFSVQGKEEEFNDSKEDSFLLLKEVLPQLNRVLKDDSHAYFFFGTKFYTETFNLLSTIFEVEPIPLIWTKNVGMNYFPQSKFTPNYETIFFCKKGKRELFKPSNAVLEYDVPSKKIHPTQKPLDLMKHLIEVSTIPGETILDPFAGSGVVGKAAFATNRKAILVEKSSDLFNAMKVYINQKEVENEE